MWLTSRWGKFFVCVHLVYQGFDLFPDSNSMEGVTVFFGDILVRSQLCKFSGRLNVGQRGNVFDGTTFRILGDKIICVFFGSTFL